MDGHAPLTREELQQLDRLMEEQGGMRLPHLHGYLTSVMTGPAASMPEKWLPLIWKDPVYTVKVPSHIQGSIDMILRQCEDIVAFFEAEEIFAPLLSTEAEPYDHIRCDKKALKRWCEGYFQGSEMGQRFEKHDEQLTLLYVPVIVLASNDPLIKKNFKEFLERISLEEFRALSAEILPVALADINLYWREREGEDGVFHRQAFSKRGRNDLCPCDSGKKYKKCCWQKMMN